MQWAGNHWKPPWKPLWLSEPCPPSYGSSWIIKKPQWNQHYLTVPDSQPSPPLADRPTRTSDGLPGNFTPCTFHKLLNSLNISLFECSLHVGQIGLKNDDRNTSIH
ncbi:hypothetical protein ILYODFUR_007838 [Ilyodon furcidens]|uniref:Uncharacterized protein n=1 Tax=Ilyodon furcidens TaxID=33524 RepID=A0ABV0VC28_9TELE